MNSLGIRKKLVIVFLPIIVLPLFIISFALNLTFSKHIESLQMVNMRLVNEKINNKFNQLLLDVDRISLNIISDYRIQNSFENSTTYREQFNEIAKCLISKKDKYINTITYIDSFNNCYNSEGRADYSVEAYLKSNIYETIKSTQGEIVCGVEKGFIKAGNNQQFFFIARKVKYINAIKNPGVLIFFINTQKLDEIFSEFGMIENATYLLSNKKNEVIYIKNKGVDKDFDKLNEDVINIIKKNEGSFLGEISNVKKLLRYDKGNSVHWSVISIIEYFKAISELRKLQAFILILTFSFTIIAIFTAIRFSYYYTLPISLLVKKIRILQKGEFPPKINSLRKDEIGELENNFDIMSIKIRKLLEDVKEEQEHARMSELNMLVHQINPHFLYNTLDNINMMARMSNNIKVSEMITAMSKLLRIGLNQGKVFITIKEELEYVTNYMLIQKMRTGESFDYIIKAENNILDNKVIKIILQPLVENAISHGFKNMRNNGLIEISVFNKEKSIVLEVADNGMGVSDEKLNRLNLLNLEEFKREDKYSGYGLKNVKARINLYYGKEYNISFNQNMPTGLVVRIIIPNYDN